MNKKLLIVMSLILVLSATIYISLKLTRESIAERKETLEKAEISFIYEEEKKILNIDTIESIEPDEFEAILDTSTTDPSLHKYRGVEIKDILNFYNIDLKDKKAVIVTGVDGYSVAYSIDELLVDSNIYIAYMEDGKYLGQRKDGGRGPYESIVVSDSFSNRRCKWIIEIEVK